LREQKCSICQTDFKEKEIQYEVLLDEFLSCDICKPVKGYFEERPALFYKLSERVYYRKKKAIICETCVYGASIEEILSFGEKIRRVEYVVSSEGSGYDIGSVSIAGKIKEIEEVDYGEDQGDY